MESRLREPGRREVPSRVVTLSIISRSPEGIVQVWLQCERSRKILCEYLHVLPCLVTLEVLLERLHAIGLLGKSLEERWGLVSLLVLQLILVPLELGLMVL
jgi:hypothetical protein